MALASGTLEKPLEAEVKRLKAKLKRYPADHREKPTVRDKKIVLR